MRFSLSVSHLTPTSNPLWYPGLKFMPMEKKILYVSTWAAHLCKILEYHGYTESHWHLVLFFTEDFSFIIYF